ncbi:MAG: transglutaminase family protein [Thermoleophilia bacterium]
MKTAWRIAHLAAFSALAATAALTVDRVVQPSMTSNLLLALGLGLLVGLPGYLHENALPGGIVLLPAGLYLLLRVAMPLPLDIETRADQFVFYSDALKLGLQSYAEDIFPVTLDADGFELLIAVAVFLFTATASVLALGARLPLAGLAVLLVLLGFTTTVDPSPSSVPTLLFLALLTVTLATFEGARRAGRGLREALGGVGLGAAAIGLALLLLAAFPGLTRPGWADWKTWDLFDEGRSTVLVFNWKQNYPRLLDPGNPIPIMKVTSRLPSYWRATTLEFFTGDTWLSSTPFPSQIPDGPGPRQIPPADPEPPGSAVQQTFELSGTSTNYIFAGGSPRSLTIDISAGIHRSDAGALRSETILPSPITYEMTSIVPRIAPQELRGTSYDYPDSVRTPYLQLPIPDMATYRQRSDQTDGTAGGSAPDVTRPLAEAGEFAEIYALSEAIVGDAKDPYEVTLRIERYLPAHYTYSLEVPPSAFVSPIAAFLFDTRTGYCQHFAGAMALLLRLNGIPARVAVGFTTGEQVGTWTYLVTSNNAHAWVEAYFAGVGWLPFDATPGRDLPLPGPSSTSPGFVDPFAQNGPTGGTGVPPTLLDATDRLPQDVETGGEGEALAARIPWGRALPALLAAALLGWPFARRWMRERLVRRGRPEQRLRASIGLLRDDLLVAGVPVRPSSTLDQVARLTGDSLSLDLGGLVRRTQEVTFGGAKALTEDVAMAERVRGDVIRLAWKKRRLARLAAWYGIAPLLEWRRTRGRADRTAEFPGHRGPTWRLRP